jgi:hypothetical protein
VFKFACSIVGSIGHIYMRYRFYTIDILSYLCNFVKKGWAVALMTAKRRLIQNTTHPLVPSLSRGEWKQILPRRDFVTPRNDTYIIYVISNESEKSMNDDLRNIEYRSLSRLCFFEMTNLKNGIF